MTQVWKVYLNCGIKPATIREAIARRHHPIEYNETFKYVLCDDRADAFYMFMRFGTLGLEAVDRKAA